MEIMKNIVGKMLILLDMMLNSIIFMYVYHIIFKIL